MAVVEHIRTMVKRTAQREVLPTILDGSFTWDELWKSK